MPDAPPIRAPRRPTAAVCEDDHALRDVLRRALTEQGMAVRLTASSAEAIRAYAEAPPDVIVLDVMLPDGDGRTACRRLRERGVTAPVIFLSARSELPDRLAAFRAGGDDYLVKPFELEELLVRVRALLRRGDSGLSQPRDDGVSLDPGAHAVVHRGQHISLTPTEFQLLAALTSAQPSGTALNRAALCAAAWPDSEEVSANALDSCLARLRAKLARAGAPDAIVTVRGFGYALR